MEKTFLTVEGKRLLEEKLNFFKTVRRPEVINKIGLAREFGDLSENAEYDAAKEEQARIESEISEMEAKLRNCVIIEKSEINTGRVNIGCTVKLFDQTFDEQIEYTIVGSTESDPIKGLISNESPVGSALLGKKVGEVVNVETPAGFIVFKVLEITA